jgi:hypothetical protein
MSLRLIHGKGVAWRALIATACAAAVLLAVLLSAFPQLHEQIHDATGAPNHECAVTLLTSGTYQHAPAAAISVPPPTSPSAFPLVSASFQAVTAHLAFSLLEHAPPALS